MKSLLTALQEGRLIELPDNNKEKSLEYLATIIEAIPDIGDVGGITEGVLARESAHNTGIGKGWACPHARTSSDGELLCAIGWSPSGVDYGASDGAPVHLVVMYFVPDSQKNAYLKEISSLAKAILTVPSMQELSSLTDLGEVRHRLLDAISLALESMAPDARARMIQLEVKQASATGIAPFGLPQDLASYVFPLQIICIPGAKPFVLGQDLELVQLIESQEQLVKGLKDSGRAEGPGVQILLRSYALYPTDRIVYDCLAFKIPTPSASPATESVIRSPRTEGKPVSLT
ncbi:MAG: PTS sugar transporter subunit IIA [Verrucomicrobia bacterium]|nr:PTS sugar transporter subunit IIA [Verrucomicrobiota bacterium]